MVWRLGDGRVEVLHPPSGKTVFPGKTGAARRNNRSAVLRVSLGDVSVLLSGDVEAEQEAWLAARTDLRSTVLLAPHHGSQSSSTPAFIHAVLPRCVVFSSEAGSRGLVHAGVLARYQAMGIRVFHTGEDGLVTFSTDGHVLTVDTHLSRRHETMTIGPRGASH
jgi:competence protein ComEC